jgi:hypothetical protein
MSELQSRLSQYRWILRSCRRCGFLFNIEPNYTANQYRCNKWFIHQKYYERFTLYNSIILKMVLYIYTFEHLKRRLSNM